MAGKNGKSDDTPKSGSVEFDDSAETNPDIGETLGVGHLTVTTLKGAGVAAISDYSGATVQISRSEIDLLILMLMKAREDLGEP